MGRADAGRGGKCRDLVMWAMPAMAMLTSKIAAHSGETREHCQEDMMDPVEQKDPAQENRRLRAAMEQMCPERRRILRHRGRRRRMYSAMSSVR